jgi:hypothetical protein
MTTNMKTKTEDKTPIDVASNVENLSDARMHWENGTLKASNNELYQLLNQCLDFYLAVPSRMITLILGVRPFSWQGRF